MLGIGLPDPAGPGAPSADTGRDLIAERIAAARAAKARQPTTGPTLG